MSKLRFHVIPVIISGSRLVNGDGVLTLSVGSYPQARSEWCNFSRQFHVFTAQGVHFPAIFRVCLKKFYLSGQIIVDLWFKVNHEVFPWHICNFFFKKMEYQKENYNFLGFFHYNFWHKMSTLNEISSCIGTSRGLVLVYVVLKPIICKICLGFLIELIEQILHTIKFGEILCSQAVYT